MHPMTLTVKSKVLVSVMKLVRLQILKGSTTLRTHVTLRLILQVHTLHTPELVSVQTMSKQATTCAI